MSNILKLFVVLSVAILVISCGGGSNKEEEAKTLVEAGNTALQDGDGSTAASKYQSALALNPSNAEANFGMAFVELMQMANDLVKFLSSDNEDIFRNVDVFMVSKVTSELSSIDNLAGINRLLNFEYDEDVVVQDLTAEQIRQEIVSLLGSLGTVDAYLVKTISATAGNETWKFTIPEDWNDPEAGTITIWRGDVLVLASGLDLLMAFMNLSIAYSPGPLGIHQNADGEMEITGLTGDPVDPPVDLNADTYIDLGEIADAQKLPDGFGVLATDGTARLNQALSLFRSAFTYGRDAVNSYIAADAIVGHWAFDEMTQADYDAFKTDWQTYGDDYAEDLIKAFSSSGVTLTIRPGVKEDDPDLVNELGEDFTVKVNFAAFIGNLPNDLRDFPIRYKLDAWDELYFPDDVSEALTDTTLLGLFPDGLTQDLYERIL
jgi:hypothetical protein